MSDAPPGWYADPSGQADLRWWDGRTWTASTRPRPDAAPVAPAPPPPAASPAPVPPPPVSTPSWELPTTEQPAANAPFSPPGAPSPDPTLVRTPTTGSGGVSSPGSFTDWGGTTAPHAAALPGAAWGAAAPAPPGPPGPDHAEGDEGSSRSWLPWALTGAGVALIIVLVGFLVVSILGSSSTPSSSGLSATGSSTTSTATTSKPGSGSSTSSTAATTTTLPPRTTLTLPAPPGTPKGPPGSVLYTDPGGSYSVSVGRSWTRTKSRVNGVPEWYIPAVPGASRATFNVTSETLPYSMGLAEYVALTEQALRTESAITQLGTDNITLADGVPATRIRYEATSNQGVRLEGLAVIAVGTADAYVETVTAEPDSADAMFAVASPYLRTLHVES